MKYLTFLLVALSTRGPFLFSALKSSLGPFLPGVVERAGTQTVYGPHSIESYFTPDQVEYIRPGLNVQVVSVNNVAAGQSPVVELLFTDDLGQPLDRNGVITPGAIGAEFILGTWNAGNYEYVNLTTVSFGPGVTYPLHDVGGTWTDAAVGDSTYTFAKVLPTDFDPTQTVTLGIYASRSTTDIIGKDYDAPASVTTFRPDGGTATPVFAAIDVSSCNTCHNPLSMHGQFGPPVQDVKLCVMCHTSQMPTTPTGESLEFKTLIHKLHDGANLPSVQAGTPYVVSTGNDFSTVVFPQNIRNCTTCHAPAAADAPIWYTVPNRAACGSCHDDVNFVTGENHPGGVQVDDSACAACHVPQGSQEFDASIIGAHTVPSKSTQLTGIQSTIVSVTNTAPGQNPTIQFQLQQNDGTPIDPSTFGSSLAVLMGGPTTDYAINPFRETASGAAFDGTTATYTFTNAIPSDATGTWAFSLEARRAVTLNPAPPDGPTFEESTINPVAYAAVTDSEAVPRRHVVDLANCNKCHDSLSLHGGFRRNTEMCVICHNPNADDSSQRPADQDPPESINFKRMIHRIHSGENLTQDYTIYGYMGSVNNFNTVRFPGDRRDCEKCHAAGTEEVSETPPPGLLPTITLRDYYSPQSHTAAACLGCHDTQAAAAHAFLSTAPFGEACATCHGPGAAFSVDQVHAR